MTTYWVYKGRKSAYGCVCEYETCCKCRIVTEDD